MPTAQEYYKSDFSTSVRLDCEWGLKGERDEHSFTASTFVQVIENAKFMAFYFSAAIHDGTIMLNVIQQHKEFFNRADNVLLGTGAPEGVVVRVDKIKNKAKLTYSMPGGLGDIEDKNIPFTGRIFIYTGNYISNDVREKMAQIMSSKGVNLVVRDAQYVLHKNATERPRAFISHASRDKEKIARPIATKLRSMGCPVWYDEFSLEVGESLRESIERGLKVSKMCILVITPNFLSKGGWPKKEYQAVFTRELVEEKNLILPVWSKVEVAEVFDYSTVLADRVALKWEELGEEEVCRRLCVKLNRS